MHDHTGRRCGPCDGAPGGGVHHVHAGAAGPKHLRRTPQGCARLRSRVCRSGHSRLPLGCHQVHGGQHEPRQDIWTRSHWQLLGQPLGMPHNSLDYFAASKLTNLDMAYRLKLKRSIINSLV